jgi:hypothetical protein
LPARALTADAAPRLLELVVAHALVASARAAERTLLDDCFDARLVQLIDQHLVQAKVVRIHLPVLSR